MAAVNNSCFVRILPSTRLMSFFSFAPSCGPAPSLRVPAPTWGRTLSPFFHLPRHHQHRPIATEIKEASHFYKAEDYHQKVKKSKRDEFLETFRCRIGQLLIYLFLAYDFKMQFQVFHGVDSTCMPIFSSLNSGSSSSCGEIQYSV